jgi:hypothetical protein
MSTSIVIPETTEISAEILKHFGLLTPGGVDEVAESQTESHSLVEGFIDGRSISLLIGDSGLGKSPLAYQLGLSVAAGVPFLGLGVQQGRVVYADHENGLPSGRDLRDNVVKFLRLEEPPKDFFSWYVESGKAFELENIVREVRPKLVIIDSLRAFDPSFEQTERAGEAMKRLRSVAYGLGTSIFAIHHIRKPGQYGPPSLDDSVLMQWLNEAAGHRSIINQSDTRIAVASPNRHEAAMIMRWHRRLRGESGPLYLNRVMNDDGEPIGYRPMAGPELLSNPEQQDAFARLPKEFTFGEAKIIYGKSDDPTRKFLLKSIAVGVVKQVGRGHYRKTWQTARVDR